MSVEQFFRLSVLGKRRKVELSFGWMYKDNDRFLFGGQPKTIGPLYTLGMSAWTSKFSSSLIEKVGSVKKMHNNGGMFEIEAM
jgi:hypothetical protein